MRKIIIYGMCTLGVLSCIVPKYKIKVVSLTPDTKSYTPMQKTKVLGDWQEGTPVFSMSEAQYHIREWQKHNAFHRRAKRAAYVKLKTVR